MDEEALIAELPPTLKEEVFFHQYGRLIEQFEFFQDLERSECIWGMVRHLSKISFGQGDIIYADNELSETMYLINRGQVKLIAENAYAFKTYT